ncbi:MAG: M20 family metallopeptidase [Gemmatimonadota bacterium]
MIEQAGAFAADLVAMRRDLHRHPELSFRETRTASVAARAAEGLGYEVRTGVGITGVVAELRNGAGPTVALRADMDALPIQEENDADYRSSVPDVMHACGHDAHVSMLVGAARLLAQEAAASALPAGTVRLLFQPSEEASDEENLSGAMRMVADGAMEGVDAVFGLHIGAHLESGLFRIGEGPQFGGSDTFYADVTGVASHAARPHLGVDGVVLAAHWVLACQQGVARRIGPTEAGVLTIGTVAGGVAENVLADRVRLSGTVRYYTPTVRERLHDTLRAAGAAVEGLGGGFELDLREGYPPVVNDAWAAELAATAVAGALGPERVSGGEPMLGAEDFAILAQHAPGCFFWLGAALEPPREHHHPRFDIDESALPLGAAALASCAVRALEALA